MPPEHRGLPRDAVRLLVARGRTISHHRFHELATLLDPGDLLVVNTSATLPAALSGTRADGTPARLHVSGWIDPDTWIVEVRQQDNRGAHPGTRPGDVIQLPAGVGLTLTRAYPDPATQTSRLWLGAPLPAAHPVSYLRAHGRPITYAHHRGDFPLSDHQTVYADQPGSAEMASAGRPFTLPLVMRLITAGVTITPLTLHCGVSSAEFHEPPAPERYEVPESTARLVNVTRGDSRRVIAVGTTVARALETVAAPDGRVQAGRGWTDLVLGSDRPARVVAGLITGLHEPASSHLSLLEAIAGPELVGSAYEAALRLRYLWHEFGDSMLLLP